MKKKVLALILSLALCASVFTGCGLIETDNQRDMDQVVAEVSIGGGAPVEKIYKKDLIVLYLNYGYMYVQNYGYTMKQTFELLMNNLVDNVLLAQTAMSYYAEKNGVTSDKFEVAKYLTEEEKEEALYNTNKAFNDMIDSYKDEEEEETPESETSSETTRSAPTGAAAYVEEIAGIDKFWEEYTKEHSDADEKDKVYYYHQDYNKKGFLAKGIVTGFDDQRVTTDIETKKAYSDVLKALDNNGLIGDDFDFEKGSIYDTEYYKDNLKTQQESILVANYEKVLTHDIISEVTYADLAARYKEMYDAQVKNSVADYETAISGASASSPVVYNPYSGYGYVYNLLLGVDDVQSAQISAIREDKANMSDAEYAAARKAILDKTTARDLRSTWITAGYDYDYEKNVFTGDYSLAKEKPLAFGGTAEWLNEDEKDDEDYKPKYAVKEVFEYDLAEFVDFMDKYLYGEAKVDEGGAQSPYYKKVSIATAPAEFDEMINDLLFAFSTDSGSLNTYKGYVSKPKVELDGAETYVKEFAEAAREVLELGRGSYIIVGTDYGYHIIFNSQTIKAGEGYETLDKYLDSLGFDRGEAYTTWEAYYNYMLEDIDEWAEDHEDDTDFYLYQLQQAYVSQVLSTKLNEERNALICKYKEKNDDGEYENYSSDYVKLYTSRYSEYLQD